MNKKFLQSALFAINFVAMFIAFTYSMNYVTYVWILGMIEEFVLQFVWWTWFSKKTDCFPSMEDYWFPTRSKGDYFGQVLIWPLLVGFVFFGVVINSFLFIPKMLQKITTPIEKNILNRWNKIREKRFKEE